MHMEKILCKLCCWQAEQNGTVNSSSSSSSSSRNNSSSSSSKFVQGSINYKLSSIKDHNSSKPYAAAKRAKEDFDARKAGLSVPPVKVVQKYHQAVILPNPYSR